MFIMVQRGVKLLIAVGIFCLLTAGVGALTPSVFASITNSFSIGYAQPVQIVNPQPVVLDSDGDGMPNWWENEHAETYTYQWGSYTWTWTDLDPHFAGDASRDYDGDELTNLEEYMADTDPHNRDTDGDGWYDGAANKLVRLTLDRIECINEEEDAGHDEVYIVVDDVRFPADSTMGGYWSMDHGDTVYPDLLVAERCIGIGTPTRFQAHIDLCEDDEVLNYEWEEDTIFSSYTLSFSGAKSYTLTHYRDSWWNTVHYRLHFSSTVEHFADPDPLDANADSDRDGLLDHEEHWVCDFCGGVANPNRKDILIETDWMGDNHVDRVTSGLVASQFWYHGIAMRVDDGWLGGGEYLGGRDNIFFQTKDPNRNYPNLYDYKYGEDRGRDRLVPGDHGYHHPDSDGSQYNGELDMGEDTNGNGRLDTHFDHDRKGIFHYCIFTDDVWAVQGGEWDTYFGYAEINGDDLIVAVETLTYEFQPIVFMHELGHNLGLDHTDPSEGGSAMGTTWWNSLSRPVNYLDSEWAELNFGGVKMQSD